MKNCRESSYHSIRWAVRVRRSYRFAATRLPWFTRILYMCRIQAVIRATEACDCVPSGFAEMEDYSMIQRSSDIFARQVAQCRN